MKIQKSLRLQKLPPYVFTAINKKKRELIAAGQDLIDLGMGDPDLPTPAPIVQKLCEAVQDPKTQGYPPYGGIPEFKKAVSEWMERRFSVTIDAETEVASLIGSKEGVVHFTQSFVNPGDFCLLPDPGYPSYPNAVLLSGGTPIYYPLQWQNDFTPRWSDIPESTWQSLRMVFVNFPHNPTSATVGLDCYRELVEKAQRYGFLILSDCAYSEHGFRELPPSALQVPGAKEVTVEMFTCSKSYNMTGWRVGFAVGNSEMIAAFLQMKSAVDTGVFKAIQWAAIEALNGDEKELVVPSREVFEYRRGIAKEALTKKGYEVFDGGGTFYLWIRTPKNQESMSFGWHMMERGVVITPGSGFGQNGEGYFRIALTVPEERLREAFDRFPEAI